MAGCSYTIKEAAAKLRVTPRTVERLVKDGKLRSVRLGRMRRVLLDDDREKGEPKSPIAPR